MPSSYYDLSYNERMKILYTLFNTFDESEQNRLLLAFEVCKELKYENDKNYRLEQTIDMILWDNVIAISIGFLKWKELNILQRHHAIKYHSLNDECGNNCEICRGIKNERKRP